MDGVFEFAIIAFTSLFVDDDEIDQHVEEYMFKDIIDENSH